MQLQKKAGKLALERCARLGRSTMPGGAGAAAVHRITCMRCRKREELMSTDALNDFKFQKVGLNLFYCDQCAKAVGW